MNFTSIKIEGGLISQEILEGIAEGTIQGQKPEDFGLPQSRRLADEIGAVWADARVYWDAFQRALARLPADDPATSETREQWVRPLLAALGYKDLPFSRRAAEIGGRSYAISHRAGETDDAPPVHIAGFRTELDRRPPTGVPRISPHALVQEYLNRTESLWGIATNGRILRVLRDSPVLSRQTYIEFDLQQLMENEGFAEFALLYRLLHRTRLPQKAEDAPDCLLERYHIETVKTGGRVRDKLRDGVEAALRLMGAELPLQAENTRLAERLRSGELTPIEYYRQLLRFVYRLLFLMVGEERGLIGPRMEALDTRNSELHTIYDRFYSIRRFRDRAEKLTFDSERHGDLWQGLFTSFKLFTDDDHASKLGMQALDGGLFGPDSMPDLEGTHLPNAHALDIIRSLSLFEDEKRVRRRVNYGALDVEELGSVYESLLDYHPDIVLDGDKVQFDLVFGSERKTTGSYYTPRELVQELIKSALVPVIEDRLKDKKTKQEQRDALLSISVCDPACGSGHFLLAAARRIGHELARVETGEDLPNPSDVRTATREVVRRCIHGVDLNPLAVDLCKVALWIEGHTPDRPLSFLDHRIKHGNSLVGVVPDMHGTPIPSDAYKPLSDDDKPAAREAKNRNEQAQRSQQNEINNIFMAGQKIRNKYDQIARMPDDTPEQVHAKEKAWEEYQQSAEYRKEKLAADLWCAPFFWHYERENSAGTEKPLKAPTTADVTDTLAGWRQIPKSLRDRVEQTADDNAFLHWRLAFPDVFARGGFDCMLGNPPWERIKLQEQEFFANHDREIATAPNAAARRNLIAQLPRTDPALATLFEKAKHAAEAESKFVRNSGRFPLTGRGDVNTYALFAELFAVTKDKSGRSGVIVPTGIATDDTYKHFFQSVVSSGRLVSLVGFINSKMIFPAVKDYIKFALVTLGLADEADFMFMLTDVTQVEDQRRHFRLSAQDLRLINPNTQNCPIFRTGADAQLTRMIYSKIPVLENEETHQSAWHMSFLTMFHMANDSHLFLSDPASESVPLYEAKMAYQYDHRFSTYEGATASNVNEGNLPQLTPEMHEDPRKQVSPRYWIERSEVESRLRNRTENGWLLGFRDVTSNLYERTAIFTVIPRVAVGHKMPLVIPNATTGAIGFSSLLSVFDSFVLDYVTRQKIGGASLGYFILKQLPVLPGSVCATGDSEFVVLRVLELVYTAWDIKGFADHLWSEADGEMREAIYRRSEENRMATGGHDWDPPEWVKIAEEGIPLPPFKWDEDRRAILRAELDAYYAKFYGLNRKQLRYILDPHGLSKKELEDILSDWEDPTCSGPHLLPSEPDLEFPGETFRLLKQREEDPRRFGEYRTRRLVLEAWERLHAQGLMPEPYDQRNDPAFQQLAAAAQQASEELPRAADGGTPTSRAGSRSSATAARPSGAGPAQGTSTSPSQALRTTNGRSSKPTNAKRSTKPAARRTPSDPGQPILLDVPPTPPMDVPSITPGVTRVHVNGVPGIALACEPAAHQSQPALRWTIRLSDGEIKTYLSPPAKVETITS